MKQSLTIITAVHNALPMNRFYVSMLRENTKGPFELVVIDNASTDGSEKFFDALSKESCSTYPVRYIRNERNLSYPMAQNQGIEHASGDIWCFLNNDIWLPKSWNVRFEEELALNPFQVLSPCGQEAQLFQQASDQLKKRWKLAWYRSALYKKVLGWDTEKQLKKSLQFMYGDLENFVPPYPYPPGSSMVGIKGDSVILHRRLQEKLEVIWDERTNASDWQLFLTLAAAREKDPTIPLPKVLLDVYGHHFLKFSQKKKPTNYEGYNLPDCSTLWETADIERLWWAKKLPHTLTLR